MKLKVVLLSIFLFFIQINHVSHAKGYNYSKTPKYGSTYGRTHSVRSYFKRNGTFVQRHRAGNPHSGVHCHNNACY